MMYKKKINLPRVNGHSLNKINSEIIDSLSDEFEFVKNSNVLLQHYIGPPPFGYKKSYLIQPMDGTLLNPIFLKNANSYDKIIVPAEASKKILKRSGVKVPIEIIPNWYENSVIEGDSYFFDSLFKEKKYTFYNESTGIKRKNVENIVRYFIDAFKNHEEARKVRLVIKITTDDDNRISRIKKIIGGNRFPEVTIINSFLEESELNSLRSGIDCYVCLSYMEGFCIPLLNAAVAKKDIICLDSKISGYTDFLNEKNTRMVSCHDIPIDTLQESLLIYDKKSRWEEADYSDYKKALIDVFRGEYKIDKNTDFSMYSKDSVMQKYRNLLSDFSNAYCISKNTKSELTEIGRIMKMLGLKNYMIHSSTSNKKIKKDTTEEASWKLNSYIEALSQSLYSNSGWTFICEDGVFIENDFQINEILKNAPEDWDVISLNENTLRKVGYLIKKSFIPNIVTRLLRRDEEQDVVFSKMKETGIGNWHHVVHQK